MLGEIFRFELRYQLRQPLFWVSSFFFFLLTFLAISTDAVVLGGSIGKIHRNAPYVIMQTSLVMSLMGVFLVTAFVASTVLRDHDHRTREMFFSTPMGKRDYLLGRFVGALTVAVGVFVPVMVAIALGSLMPWLDPERIGAFHLEPYLFSLLVLVVPNVFLSACVFFSLANWTRSLFATYGGVVAFFVGYAVAGNLLSDVENEGVAMVVDPFGFAAFQITTKYWTVAERNSQVLELAGPFLMNRLLWLAVGLVIFALAYWRFSFTVKDRRRKRKAGEETVRAEAGTAAATIRPVTDLPAPGHDFSPRARLGQLAHQAKVEITGVARSLAFPILLAFGVLNMVGNLFVIDQLYGTPVYPVTHLVVSVLQGGFLFVFIIITFYSGELVWRERSVELDEVVDALPVPSWVLWGGKLIALGFVVLSLLATAMLTGMGFQAWRGYTHFEPALYLSGLFLVVGIPFLLAAGLAFFLQVVTNNKYLGFLLMILYFISNPTLAALDFDHNLYQFGDAPGAPYSDMNGWGHFVEPLFWFYLYWIFGAVILTVLAHLLWVRGKGGGLRERLALARQRLAGAPAAVLVVAVTCFVACGAYIFYNTNVINEYLPDDEREAQLVRREKTYKRYEGLAQPRITAVYAEVDIYPERRDVEIRGTYRLVNKTDDPIEALHVSYNASDVTVRSLELPGVREAELDDELGYRIYHLEEPLAPGEATRMDYDLAVLTEGFVNQGSNTKVVRNGTFFNSFDYFPRIGYTGNLELTDPNERRKRGLPPVERMPSIDDEAARRNNYISRDTDWVEFETVVSTSADQVALAPGYLTREWREGERRYFHYAMDAPILGFWSYLSADWEVARDRWRDVAIEIYHHPEHDYNVARMIEATKKSLDYFTRNFSPYQHRQVRIVEFPRYARFAQSFPNTIPFSESIGFIARLEDDPEAIDYVFYVTAHEVAHQWWAHQVIGAEAQGATVLSETLAQYSALMVMEEEYGPEMMRRFLRYELDSYLSGRGGELIEELPLLLVENQPYIHYRKGSLVMYALKDYLGEDAVNRALARLVDGHAFTGPPYPTSRALLAELEAGASSDQQALLHNLFETITLYENRAVEATYRERPDGKYLVRLAVASEKLRADGQGVTESIPVSDWMDVMVFGETGDGAPPEGEILFAEKRRITEPETVFELVVDERPVQAGIDPFHKLIDRNPDNNLTKVSANGEGLLVGLGG